MTEIKRCEACGRDFGCGVSAEASCWCAETELSADAIQMLREKYNDCLCPGCLKQMQTGVQKS